MYNDTYELPLPYQQILDQAVDPVRVSVTLLDRDNLPLARGAAVLPLVLGVGVFWPSCPMPTPDRLSTAKYFALPSGEKLKLRNLSLCDDSPPQYHFWANPS